MELFIIIERMLSNEVHSGTRALNRPLKETNGFKYATHESIEGLGPYGVSKTFKPRSYFQKFKSFFGYK